MAVRFLIGDTRLYAAGIDRRKFLPDVENPIWSWHVGQSDMIDSNAYCYCLGALVMSFSFNLNLWLSNLYSEIPGIECNKEDLLPGKISIDENSHLKKMLESFYDKLTMNRKMPICENSPIEIDWRIIDDNIHPKLEFIPDSHRSIPIQLADLLAGLIRSIQKDDMNTLSLSLEQLHWELHLDYQHNHPRFFPHECHSKTCLVPSEEHWRLLKALGKSLDLSG